MTVLIQLWNEEGITTNVYKMIADKVCSVYGL